MTAQVVTITELPYKEIKKITWDWLCTDAGAVVGAATTNLYSGILSRIETIPDGGDTAPTALYDITLKNDDGVDLLSGLGADRSATLTETKNFNDGLGVLVKSKLTLAVSSAGNAKGGIVIAYILE